ncbi:MAG: hypothetical protein ACTHKF_07655 [Candidatus Nitrosocosmicus sp.]
MLKEIVENLVHLSDKHFVIVTYQDIDNLIKRPITSKFKNVMDMSKVGYILKGKENNKDTDLQMKIDPLPDNLIDEISFNE